MEKTMTEFGLTCQFYKVDHVVMADQRDVANSENGALIQDAMPYLSADDRELLISGTCGACFDKMFPPDPENDD